MKMSSKSLYLILHNTWSGGLLVFLEMKHAIRALEEDLIELA